MRKNLLRSLLVPAVAAAVLIPVGAAQARPVLDDPIYCPPGTHQVGGDCRATYGGSFR